MSIAILIGLIILNGLFAMSEIALVTARKNRLQLMAEEGNKAANVAIALSSTPNQFLSTVQIGMTVIGILNGVVSEDALAGPISAWLQSTFSLSVKTASFASTTIAVFTITYFTIVIGELVPKRLAQFNAELFATRVARIISILSMISRPFVMLLSGSTDIILRMLGHKNSDGSNLTEEDIHAVITEGSMAGVIHQQEHDMVRNVFHFDDRRVSSLMTPRNEINFLDLNHSVDSFQQQLLSSSFSCLPVCDQEIENVQGTINAKQLLRYQLENTEQDPKLIIDYITPPVFIPETWNGTQLLDMFRSSGEPIVFVVDEYGDIQGVVTPQDILVALTGKFNTLNQEDVWSIQNEDGSWTLDGLIPVTVVKDLLYIKKLPDEEQNAYHTLNGMMEWLLGGLPQSGDSIQWSGWQFNVLSVEHNRIDKVKVQRVE